MRDDGRHDPDAAFKRPVPQPDGYVRGNTGGRNPADSARFPDHASDRTSLGIASLESLDSAPEEWDGADGERPEPLRATVDQPCFYHPACDYPPDRYADPLTAPDGSRVPCFDGPPRREQTTQGWPGDCGVIAALGAIAAHRPGDITGRIRPLDNGSYQVTLSEARRTGGVTVATGRDIELTVSPQLPVYDEDPGVPACAQAEGGTAWCALYEKALAGVDQTWTADRRISWSDDWAGLCARDTIADVEKPRSGPAPGGYVRLHQGSTPWERAEVLTQLTGDPAVVREFPTGHDDWSINRILRTQLNQGKPVLVDSRAKEPGEEDLPSGLKEKHVYEVTGVEKGKIILRNPWNRDHPLPMETDEFARDMSRYYSTLI